MGAWQLVRRDGGAIDRQFTSLAEIVAYLHQQAPTQKIVHRDLGDRHQLIVKDQTTRGRAGLRALVEACVYEARAWSFD